MATAAIIALTLGLALGTLGAVNVAKTGNPLGDGSLGNAFNNFLGLDKDGNQQFDTALQANLQGAQDQRDWQEKMYYIDRDYTSPANQMRLYREAGLNPSLMYGQSIQTGQIGSGAEATSPSPSSGLLGALSSLLGLGQDAMMMPAQVDLMRAQAEEIRSRIPVNQQKVNESKAREQDLLQGIENKKQQVQLMITEGRLNEAKIRDISFEQNMKNQYLTIDLQKLGILQDKTKAEISKMEAEQREILARAKVTERELYEMINTFALRRAGLEKTNALTDAQIRTADATAEKLRKEGVRLDQILSTERNTQATKNAIYDMAHSSNPLESFGGCLLMSIDYAADGILGSILK